MAKRRKNTVDFVEEVSTPEERIITLVDARAQFLRDIRGLAKQTQRWHKENLNSLEKVLGMQGVTIEDCRYQVHATSGGTYLSLNLKT